MLDLVTEIALYAHPARQQEAERIAHRFNLPLASKQGKNKYRLYLGPEGLALQDLQPKGAGPIFIDFTSGRAQHRRLFGGGKRQPLARAIGIKGSRLPRILDATAGFGRDAFVLASLGCEVALVERSPVLAALLFDAMERAEISDDTSPICKRMTLTFADSRKHLLSLANTNLPDTIYLDPMYPHRNKSALVKKEMRIGRDVVGDDEDSDKLLEVAQTTARERVVVKRPINAEPLGNLKPTMQIKSKNTRYDIYITTIINT